MIRRALYHLASTVGPMAALRRRFEFLLESQYWSEARRKAYQREHLHTLLDHAVATVPFYRQYWQRRGVDARAAADPDRLGDWPVISKADLKAQFAQLSSERPHRTAFEYATGGSSGNPVKLLIDRDVKRWRWAAKMRNLEWMGWHPGDRIAFIWGSDFDRKRTDKLTTRLFRRASNQVWLNTFCATEAEYVAFARFLARWRPRILVGYASSLMHFHGVCEADGALRRSLALRGIQSSAEVLHEENKQRLRDCFGCGVFDLYGQREVGNIAQNSRDGGPLLTTAESVVVETLSPDRIADRLAAPLGKNSASHCSPGPPASRASHVVVTDLRNYSFPLIRYDTGDLAESTSPDPGESRTLPALGPVTGRQAEMLHAPNGRLVHCEYFAHLFYKLDHVKQFQLRIARDGSVVLRYVTVPQYDDIDIQPVLNAIKKDIDPSWRVRAERVSHIAPLASGKHRYIVRDSENHG